MNSGRVCALHWNVAMTAAPPAGMVTEHSLPENCGQFSQVTEGPFAVSRTEEFTSYEAMHAPGQLIPAGRLITVPVPITPTLNVATVPPPGQIRRLGSST